MERHMCDENVFHLPREEPEKDKNKPKIYFPPRSPIFFLSFPSLYLCVHHLHSTFPFVVALPPSLSLSSSFQVSFLSFLLIFPFAPFTFTEKTSSSPPDRGLKVGTVSSAQNSSISHYPGSNEEPHRPALPGPPG